MIRRMSFVCVVVSGLLLGLINLAQAQESGPQSVEEVQALAGTAFTYQGQLKNGGTGVTGSCEMAFRLFDAATLGGQVGAPITQTVAVNAGLFTTQLNFGTNAFDGQARWLEIAVRCTSDAGFTVLSRQALTPAPYALALPGLYTRQNATSPNIIGGYAGNSIWAEGSVIGGGGSSGNENRVQADYAVVGGGQKNTINAYHASISGGYSNTVNSAGMYAMVGGGGENVAGGPYNVIGGGWGNATSYEWHSTIGGGWLNNSTHFATTIGGGRQNTASNRYATIGGGEHISVTGHAATVAGGSWITATGNYAAVGGGSNNMASADSSTVGGGYGNAILITGTYAVIGGGENNMAHHRWATVGGGNDNIAGGDWATVGGGGGNNATGLVATVGGGWYNAASGQLATIGGGELNIASGVFATVPGGRHNIASGEFSFAGGQRAEANHNGTFVWADSTDADFASTTNNQFLIRAGGGVGINVTNTIANGLTVGGRVIAGGTGVPTGSAEPFVARGSNAGLSLDDRSDATDRWVIYANDGTLRFWNNNYSRIIINNTGAMTVANSLAVNTLGSAGSTTLCRNASNQIATCSSSIRYKDNVSALDLGLDTIAQLRPVTFDWTGTGEHDLGFVAEEVDRVTPLLTTRNAEGQVEGVKYDRVSAVLVKAVQEQQQQIVELKQQNAELQARLADLDPATASFNVFNGLSVLAIVAVVMMIWQQRRSKRGE